MKKLYSKATVHPSPPHISDCLAFLPAAILALTAALNPDEKEILAYLITYSGTLGTWSSSRKNAHREKHKLSFGGCAVSVKSGDHPPLFNCVCFRCYTRYWARWDSAPNRQSIHEIIEAFEDWLLQENKNKKDRKKKAPNMPEVSNRVDVGNSSIEAGTPESAQSGGGSGDGEVGGEVKEKGSVRKLMSFIGERILDLFG